jgi:hypothetical protein
MDRLIQTTAFLIFISGPGIVALAGPGPHAPEAAAGIAATGAWPERTP